MQQIGNQIGVLERTPEKPGNAVHQWPEQAAARDTHDKVFEVIQRHFPNPQGLKMLDLPCGAGAFSARLASAGIDVTPMDIEAVTPFYADENKRILGDANQPLPFADSSFDAVVTIEGIEHLENPTFFLRECARVTRPGGMVIMSTPNVDSLRSRKYVMLYGYHKYFGPFSDYHKDSWHMLPVDMIFVRGASKKAGLEIVDLAVNNMKGKNLIKEMLRPFLTRKLPEYLRGQIPYYGEVIIYAMKKAE